MQNLRIGITIDSSHKSIWIHGLQINIILLYKMLKQSSNNYEVCILTAKKFEPGTLPDYLKDLNVYSAEEKADDLDLIIIMGTDIHHDIIKKFKSKPNKKIIMYKCGNNYMIGVEEIIYKEKNASNKYAYYTDYDEVWYIPQLHETNPGFYHVLYRTNTNLIPFIWAPDYIQQGADSIDAGHKSGKYSKDHRYTPKDKKVLGVLEPNINVQKFCLLPAMIAEKSYRGKIGKEKIDAIMLGCTDTLKTNEPFLSYLRKFDLFTDKKVTSEGRYPLPYILTQYMDVIISHQMLIPLNYLYMDVAYLGYPILHNAWIVKDIGYYYEKNDVIQGAKQLDWILEHHDSHLEEYKAKTNKVIERYLPTNPTIIATYDKLIDNLFTKGGNFDLDYNFETNRYNNLSI